MVDSVAFRTRARTIDHLGREQIADCPTAVSELWKNAYDAYAETVGLHVYDGALPIAVVVDDGHGMDRDEFVEKWLVVGTESKAIGAEVLGEDRNGLPERPKQGQKGIGRLSSAFLGPLLLVVSKRRRRPFTAALIDWRVFENPFLYLEDVEIPVVEFDEKEAIFEHLPTLFDTLMGNLWGNGRDSARDVRIAAAWRSLDTLEAREGRPLTRAAMEEVAIEAAFEARHFQQWPLWQGDKEHGTILLVADIVFDLEALLKNRVCPEDEAAAQQATDRLYQTLSSFTDPFVNTDETAEGYGAMQFRYSVASWEGAFRRSIISGDREFDLANLHDLEHVVDGRVDEQGVFIGRVKAFGNWLNGEVRINPKVDVPNRGNSSVGPFHLRLGTFAQELRDTSHTPEVHQWYKARTDKFGGVMVYRNGLRVMPYGREDNDFFEIEKRRTLHAGRYFWSNRRTFGHVALTREGNPNLKDKAGREGLIDNKATKVFRDLVINILVTTARNYFGTDSDVQKRYLPAIKAERAKEKAEAEQKRQRARLKRQFRTNLRKYAPELSALVGELEGLAERIRNSTLTDETEVAGLRERLKDFKNRSKEMVLGEPPRNLGSGLEEEYDCFRLNRRKLGELLTNLEDSMISALEALRPRAPREIAYSDLSSHATFLQSRLRRWLKEAKELLESEQHRLTTLYEERSKNYHSVTLPLVDDVEHDRIPLHEVLKRLADERDKTDLENAEIFEPYIAALRSLQENIDLENLAAHGMDAVEEMREEVDRLHGLAQLGITVEIIGHEIEGLELTISEGLKELTATARESEAFVAVKTAHEALVDRLRFLSPLKLSGPKFKTHLSGSEILNYVERFFGTELAQQGIVLDASERFLRFSVYEQPARIFPVFINLVNNAMYWVRRTPSDARRIRLDIVDTRVVVSDSGPGVEEEDRKNLFKLFFTRKVRGGRGVGLYLCRANLAAGGHTIEYAVEEGFRLLSGANFVIDFKGAKYD